MQSTETPTVRQARAEYFRANGFGDGGYDQRWVKLMAGPLPIVFPNTAARVRAVKLHDLHHVATGYETTWIGEAEIAAWELSAGCADHYAAWWLNLLGLVPGLLLDPARVFAAYLRAQPCRSLYQGEFEDRLLGLSLEDLRRELGLMNPPAAPTATLRRRFAAWCVAGLCTVLTTTAIVWTPPVLALVYFCS